jgi:dihydropyrimidinase
MHKVDLTIKGGKIVNPTGIVEAGVAIDEGKIVSVAKEPNLPDSDQVINAKGLLILPGAIDPHVHIFPWGRRFRREGYVMRKATFETETVSAAFGGVTCLMDFVLNEPGDDPSENLEECIREATTKSVIDFAFHFGIGGSWKIEDAQRYIDHAFSKGITSVKIYMCYRTEGFMVDDDLLYATLHNVAKKDGVSLIHAENGFLVDYLKEKYVREGRFGPKTQLEARPSFLEEEAILSSLALAEAARAKTYIVHLTTKDGLNTILDAKRRGQTVYIEANPNWLFFTQEDTEKKWPLARETPPFRTKADTEALWHAITQGQIDTIATDHSPQTMEMKMKSEKIGGFAGVEIVLPLMYSECTKRGLSPSQIVALTSYNASRIFKLPGKGLVYPGYDADFVLLDPKKEMIVRADRLHTTCDFSLYEGWTLKGVPVTTILGGHVICSDGQFYGKHGSGRYVSRNGSQGDTPRSATS